MSSEPLKESILLVDDNPSIIRCLKVLLGNNFNLLTANSGKEALEVLSKNNVQCIVSDYDMECGDGLFLLKNVPNKEIPFLQNQYC